jgi:hypothetical protein
MNYSQNKSPQTVLPILEVTDEPPMLVEDLYLDPMADGEPFHDPRRSVAEEIEYLKQIAAYLEISFDGKIMRADWDVVDSTLESKIPEVKELATKVYNKLVEEWMIRY